MMKSFASLTLTFLLLVVEAQSDLVIETCKQTPLPQLCVSTLRSDPRSKTADVAGLGLIVVGAVKAKVTAALTKINSLIPGSRPPLKGPLSECAEVYGILLKAIIPSAVEALTKGDPKFAESGVAEVALEAESCEDNFKGKSKSPLTDVNKAMHDLAEVARAITRLLL